MTTAHVPSVHAEVETLLHRHGYPGARVEVVRSPGDSTDGCLTIFFRASEAGKHLVALVRPASSGVEVEIEFEPW